MKMSKKFEGWENPLRPIMDRSHLAPCLVVAYQRLVLLVSTDGLFWPAWFVFPPNVWRFVANILLEDHMHTLTY